MASYFGRQQSVASMASLPADEVEFELDLEVKCIYFLSFHKICQRLLDKPPKRSTSHVVWSWQIIKLMGDTCAHLCGISRKHCVSFLSRELEFKFCMNKMYLARSALAHNCIVFYQVGTGGAADDSVDGTVGAGEGGGAAAGRQLLGRRDSTSFDTSRYLLLSYCFSHCWI